MLYGEIFEVDRNALAMRDEEAADMLGEAHASADVIGATRGWPAVITFAAVSETLPRGLLAEPQLYGFFADEIFARLDRRTRRTLCELALYDRAGRGLALAKLGRDEAHRAIAVGLGSGFLAEQADGEIEVHPLARQFLLMKLREEQAQGLGAVVGDAVATLTDHRLWDEAHGLIAEFERAEDLPRLVDAAMDDLLTTGRSATLRSWLGDSIATHPALLLASAELAFREGRFYEAEALAAHAANDLNSSSDFSARAAFVAGRAAHIASREAEARGYSNAPSRSRVTRPWGGERRWVRLLPRSNLKILSSRTCSTRWGQHGHLTRQPKLPSQIATWHTRLASSARGSTSRPGSFELLRFVRDPVARTSFKNTSDTRLRPLRTGTRQQRLRMSN